MAVLATAASLAITTQIELRTSFKDLLGEQDPVAQQLAYFEDNFPIASTVRVLMEGRDPDRLIAAGAALTERLEAHPDRIRYVAFEQPVDFFVEHSLLYLDVDDLRFAEASLAEQQAPLRALMADPSALGMMGGLDALMAEQARPADTVARINSRVFGELELGDAPESGQAANVGLALNTGSINRQLSEQLIRTIEPLPLPPSREETLQGLRAATELFDMVADVLEQGERVTPEAFSARARALQDQGLAGAGMPLSRYALSPDGTALVIDLFTAEPVLDIEVARPFLAWLEPMVDEVAKLYPDVSLRLTGLPVMFKQENEALLDNFALVTLLGFVGILAVFIIGFERVGLPSLSGIPLVMGATWTFGVITVVNGGLTLFSLTFPVLLFGIGIDFAIHLMSGYSEQRREGLEPEEALNVAFDKIGAGLLTGALTTAMAFLVMMTSAFYGYKDMGFTAGVGVLTALLAMLTVLPAIMVMWDQRQQARGEMLPDVPFPFLEPLGRILVRNRYLVLAAFLVVSLTFGYFAAESRLDQNYLNIIPKDIPAARAQARILEVYGTSNEIVTFFADDLEQAERIRAAAEATPSIAEVMSPSALVPEHQADKEPAITAIGARLAELPPPQAPSPHTYDADEVAQLRRHLASIKVSALQLSMLSATLYDDDVRQAAGELRDVINRVDARTSVASAGRLSYLDRLLAQEIHGTFERFQRMSGNTSLTPEQLPQGLRTQLQGADGRWLVVVRAAGDIWDREFRDPFMQDLGSISSDYVGAISAWHRGLVLLVAELPKVFGLTALVVFGLVWIDLRSLRATALAMVPLVLGLIWTVGTMAVLDLPFNMLSIIAIPLLVGIGIDNGVHIYHRVRKEHDIPLALARSGKPVLLTSMTTAIGFGSLMLSVHPGIHDLGMVTAIGIASCLCVSLLLLPALVAIFDEDVLAPKDEEP